MKLASLTPAVLAALLLAGCERPAPAPAAAAAAQAPAPAPMGKAQRVHFARVAPGAQPSEPLVQLGRMLYFEKRLSKNHDLSCNSCHALGGYGVDNKPFSPGHKGQLGGRNSPTVYDAVHNTAQFWDGRAKDLEAQATGPILNPVEMAMPDGARVVRTLESIPQYVAHFRAAFPADATPVTLQNAAKAIAAFESQLVTRSRFDDWVDGKDDALSDVEKRGLTTFMNTGCAACHGGGNLGGQLFLKVGLYEPWPNQKDLGRFDLTKDEADRLVFRAAPLRNVEKTAPYFHDGSGADLTDAVTRMARHQLGRTFTPTETAEVVAFLQALTGKLPDAKLIAEPALPPSTAKTPSPDPS